MPQPIHIILGPPRSGLNTLAAPAKLLRWREKRPKATDRMKEIFEQYRQEETIPKPEVTSCDLQFLPVLPALPGFNFLLCSSWLAVCCI